MHEHNRNRIPTPDASRKNSGPKLQERREWKVAAIVLVAFLGFEGLFRVAGSWLSKDIAHMQTFGERAERFALASRHEKTLKTLFLGNSLTRYGVNQKVFTKETERQIERTLVTEKINPDNTSLAEWYYVYRNYFADLEDGPDVLIIGFEGRHLRDAPARHLDRLAYYYRSDQSLPDLFHFDAKTFEQRAFFTLCQYSAAFANRDRIQRRLLDKLIPSYRDGMDQLNQRMLNEEASTQGEAVSYERLMKLIALAERKETQVILTAMPVPRQYEFDPELLDIVRSTSAVLVDCRLVPGIREEMFFDGLHMDEQAGELYSERLADLCAPILQKLPVRNPGLPADRFNEPGEKTVLLQ